MKAVILVLAALVAVNAQTCSRTPVYTQKISPVVCPAASIQLPNYEDSTTYYQCTNSVPTLTNCASGNLFSYVYQECAPCATYLPSAQCSALKYGPTCVDISTSTTTTTTTAAPTTTTTTTAAPSTTTTTTTAAPGEGTTSNVPTPPTSGPSDDGSTTPSGSDDIITPTGTTISVPQPPSPNDNNVPTPVTPVPTAPIINDGPPVANDVPTS